MKLNAAAQLLAHGEGAQLALAAGGRQLSYDELRLAVARAGGVWRDVGVAPGERIVVGLNDGIDWVLAVLGAMWIGAVAVPVNPRCTAAQWQGLASHAQARWLLAQSLDGLPQALHAQAWSCADWHYAISQARPVPALAVEPDTPACWSYSSGTSGAPKAVVHGHRFGGAVERVAQEVLGIGPADRLFASSRLFFVYPLANSLLAGLKLGATVVLDAAWPSPVQALRVIAEQRPTVFFSVPSLLRDLLRDGSGKAIAESTVRLAVSAGEPLPSALRSAWVQQTGIPLVNGYGASETMCLVLVDSGSGLRPAPGVQVRWLQTPEAGMPGRVLLRAPTLALGYWHSEEAQAESFRDAGFSPADLFERQDDDQWRFAGREDSLVKVSGRWVDLAALEEALASADAVQETAAVAVSDGDGVQVIAVFYIAQRGQHAQAAQSLTARIRMLPTHQQPRWQHALPELPRTATGKLLRRQLQHMHGLLLQARALP